MITWFSGKLLPHSVVRALSISALLALATAANAGGTYYTDSDNENDAGTGTADNDMDVTVNEGGHIEFNIDVATPPTNSAVLTVYANDVDEEQGEIDDVFLNGTKLGRLSGANNVWSSTVFQVDPALIVVGDNTVRVDVSTGGGGWIVKVDWGQLLVDGGAADKGDTGSVDITGYSIASNTVTVDTSVAVNSIAGGNYRLEVSIVAPNGDSASVLSQTFTAAASELKTISISPTYLLNSVSGTYTVQAQLFWMNGSFPVQQDVATTTFEHVQNVGRLVAIQTAMVCPTRMKLRSAQTLPLQTRTATARTMARKLGATLIIPRTQMATGSSMRSNRRRPTLITMAFRTKRTHLTATHVFQMATAQLVLHRTAMATASPMVRKIRLAPTAESQTVMAMA